MNNEVVAKRLAKARGNKTREEVAKYVGVTVSALGMYERGERVPRDETKIKLAKCYDKDVQELFFEK
ncbi:MAG: helix-turn-helix transcriptional regulator [Anaerovoracaceae bacterium]